MTCDERANQILHFAAGVAEPAEADELGRHLATGCLQCAGRLAEARTMLAMIPLALQPQNPPALVRQRIMSGLSPAREAARENVSAKRSAPVAPTWGQIALPSLIAACVAAALTIFFNWRVNAGRNNDIAVQLDQAKETIRMMTAYVDAQQTELNQSQIQTASWAADQNLRLLSLQPTPLQPTAHARIFWDTTNHKWHFFACGLKDLPQGKKYELWAIGNDGSAPLAIGGFNPSNGDAAIDTTIPQTMTPAAAAVTDEPAATTVTTPTGNFQLKGTVN